VVAALFQALPESKRAGAVARPGQGGVTFGDALGAVRRWLGAEGVFPRAGAAAGLAIVPASIRELLLTARAPAS
jgi:hypothetical protein